MCLCVCPEHYLLVLRESEALHSSHTHGDGIPRKGQGGCEAIISGPTLGVLRVIVWAKGGVIIWAKVIFTLADFHTFSSHVSSSFLLSPVMESFYPNVVF